MPGCNVIFQVSWLACTQFGVHFGPFGTVSGAERISFVRQEERRGRDTHDVVLRSNQLRHVMSKVITLSSRMTLSRLKQPKCQSVGCLLVLRAICVSAQFAKCATRFGQRLQIRVLINRILFILMTMTYKYSFIYSSSPIHSIKYQGYGHRQWGLEFLFLAWAIVQGFGDGTPSVGSRGKF